MGRSCIDRNLGRSQVPSLNLIAGQGKKAKLPEQNQAATNLKAGITFYWK